MNAYLIHIPEERTYMEPLLDDGTGPIESWRPVGVWLAEKPTQAKVDALKAWSIHSRTGVYSDDYLALRVRLLAKEWDGPRGEAPDDEALWLRVHEVLDHDNQPCSCPVEETQP